MTNLEKLTNLQKGLSINILNLRHNLSHLNSLGQVERGMLNEMQAINDALRMSVSSFGEILIEMEMKNDK